MELVDIIEEHNMMSSSARLTIGGDGLLVQRGDGHDASGGALLNAWLGARRANQDAGGRIGALKGALEALGNTMDVPTWAFTTAMSPGPHRSASAWARAELRTHLVAQAMMLDASWTSLAEDRAGVDLTPMLVVIDTKASAMTEIAVVHELFTSTERSSKGSVTMVLMPNVAVRWLQARNQLDIRARSYNTSQSSRIDSFAASSAEAGSIDEEVLETLLRLGLDAINAGQRWNAAMLTDLLETVVALR